MKNNTNIINTHISIPFKVTMIKENGSTIITAYFTQFPNIITQGYYEKDAEEKLEFALYDILKYTLNDNKSSLQKQINRIVCDHFKVSPNIILTKNKNRDITIIRQIAQYFGKIFDRESNRIIGENTGGQKGCTVCNSYEKIKKLINNPQTPYNKKLAQDVEEINRKLKI